MPSHIWLKYLDYDVKQPIHLTMHHLSTRNAHMVLAVYLIRFENGVYIYVEVSIWISCAWPFYSLVVHFLKYCTLTNKAAGTIWRTCQNLLRGDKVLIYVPSYCLSGLLQPSDLNSLPDWRSIACPTRMSLYIYLINFINYVVCVLIFMTSPLGVAVGLLSI